MYKEVAFEEFRIPVPWGFIAGVAWGNDSGFPVLCLHGILDNANSFALLVPHLPKRFFYVAIDLPGHGRSSSFVGGFPIEFNHLVYAVTEVVEHFKWNKIYIIGHSMGAHVASFFAALYPEMVVKAIFLDGLFTTPVASEEYLPVMNRRLRQSYQLIKSTLNKQPPSYSYDDALDRLINHRLSPITVDAGKALSERCLISSNEGFRYSTDLRYKMVPIPTLLFDHYEHILREIKCPCFLIVSSESIKAMNENKLPFPIYTKEILKIFNELPNAKYTMISGHHDVYMNDPRAVAKLITPFLGDTQSSL